MQAFLFPSFLEMNRFEGNINTMDKQLGITEETYQFAILHYLDLKTHEDNTFRGFALNQVYSFMLWYHEP